jgi:hypothetical protein
LPSSTSAPCATVERNLARLIDLVCLWTFLERAPVDPAIVRDVTPLLVATVDAFAQ